MRYYIFFMQAKSMKKYPKTRRRQMTNEWLTGEFDFAFCVVCIAWWDTRNALRWYQTAVSSLSIRLEQTMNFVLTFIQNWNFILFVSNCNFHCSIHSQRFYHNPIERLMHTQTTFYIYCELYGLSYEVAHLHTRT